MTQVTDARRASDILYDEIFASRNSIRRENIRIIKQVCDQMEKDRVGITTAEVVRRGGENGPAYSTISNKGSMLGDYIKQRIAEQTSKRPLSKNGEHNLADNISDPVLAAQVRDKESSARWFHKENTALRQLFKSLSPGVDIDAALTKAAKGHPFALAPPQPTENTFCSAEISAALLCLMDHLVRDRQYVEMRGRLTINHKVVLGPSELQAYRRACGLTEDAWQKRYGRNDI